MNCSVPCGMRKGCVRIPASKSYAHRYLILAALSKNETLMEIDGFSRDITATMDCLRALGARIEAEETGLIRIAPLQEQPDGLCHLYCGESGSTLRFLLPLAGALGKKAVFHMEGRLPERPLDPLDQVLEAHGMTLRKEGSLLYTEGSLQPGSYSIPGNISSQYISGLLMALPLLSGPSTLAVTGKVESADYIAMTESVLQSSGIELGKEGWSYSIAGGQKSSLSGKVKVEADWSNGAFFLVMGALSSEGILVQGLNPQSAQGDRRVLSLLQQLGAQIRITEEGILAKKGELKGITIDAAPIPDLIPVLCAAAAGAEGTTRVINAGRLRLKESDRIATTVSMLSSLGADIKEEPEGMVICGRGPLAGGTAEAFNDHRIAMTAAAAASICTGPVEILGAQCVQKSYPGFFEDLNSLEEVLA